MAIDPKLLVIKPVNELAEVTGLQAGSMLFYDGSDNLKRISIDTFNNLSKTAKPLAPTGPTPTAEGLYKPTISGTYTNAGGLVAQVGYDTLFFFNGTTWTKSEFSYPQATQSIVPFSTSTFPLVAPIPPAAPIQRTHNESIWQLKDGQTASSTDVPGISDKWVKIGGADFSESQFNEEAQKYGQAILISKDLSAINFTKTIASGAGDSIYTFKTLEAKKIGKLRIKIAAAGKGNFTYRRGGAIHPLISDVDLVAGWNEIPVNFDMLENDLIGYSTVSSTATIYFADGTGGNYYTGEGKVSNGNIAMEIYGVTPHVKSFKKIVLSDLDKQFTADSFNTEASKLANDPIINKDLNSVFFDKTIGSGQGTRLGTWILKADKVIKRLRIKVRNNGLGFFAVKRNGSFIDLAKNISLVAGWNTIDVDFNALKDDMILYSTSQSTADIYFTDRNTGGQYFSQDGTPHRGNIALEVYGPGDKIEVKSFSEVVLKGSSAYPVKTVQDIVGFSKLRKEDHGVISYFPSVDKADELGNNQLQVVNGNIKGQFSAFDSKYIWTCGFKIKMPVNKFTSTKTLAEINYGGAILTISAGGVGIVAARDNSSNFINYEYQNKIVSFVVKADAYFLYVIVDGLQIRLNNINKKLTAFGITLYQDNGQVIKNLAFWNRFISKPRIAEWDINSNPYAMITAEDRVFPQEGYQISDHILHNNQYGYFMPAEQNIVKFKDKFFLYGTMANSTPTEFIEAGVGVCISSRVDGGYAMYTDDVVIGGGRNKANYPRAMASWAGVKDGFVYVFAAKDYISSKAGGGIFKSSDGLNFTKVGDIPNTINKLANMGFWPEKVGNYYYGLIEGWGASGGAQGGQHWVINLVRSTNWESGWEVVQLLPSLQVGGLGRMYGGPKIMRTSNNDRWIIVYHAAHELNGNVPTSLFYAECFDDEPKNWVNIKPLLQITDELDFYNAYNCDQVATPHIIEEGGKTYLSYVLAQNSPNIYTQIRIAQFDGTKEELFGIVPY